MIKSTSNNDRVLIVGAGPSGLMMAHELVRYGIPVTIIEKDTTKSPYSRAIAVQIRTLEIFSALGLIEHLKEESNEVGAIELVLEGRKTITVEIARTTSSFNNLMIIDQPHTEKVLEDALERLGVSVHYGCELVDVTADQTGINATLRDRDQQVRTERFSYIVGADGAHSLVRKRMANSFLGSTYDEAFILADAECVHPFGHNSFRLFFKKKRFLALIPMKGRHHYRLISVRRYDLNKAGPLPTIEEFQALAKEVVPYPFEIKNPVWVSRFFVQCRSASHYQEDRIFLVGDSAHIHSPAGGQGMNTGLQDAFNLAFKLAMNIKGYSSSALLASYETERKPVGDFLIDRTDRLFKFTVRSSIWARLLRWFFLPHVARSARLRRKLFTIGSQTGIRYESGAICIANNHLRLPGVRVGERVANLLLVSNLLKKTDLHTLISELYFSCLLFFPAHVDKKDVKAAIKAAERLTARFAGLKTRLIFASDFSAEKVLGDGEYLMIYDESPLWPIEESFYVVVRPDHQVFCAGVLADLSHAETSLNKFLTTKGKPDVASNRH